MKSTVLVGFLALPLLVACAVEGHFTGPAATASSDEIVLRHNDRVSGTIRARTLRVEPGAVVIVDDDLLIEALDSILIAGELRASDVAIGDERSTAPSMTLEAGNRLTVTGSIVGGRGKSFVDLDPEVTVGRNGGGGSNITLGAPDALIAGLVHAGEGGQGGGGADCGPGGSIVLVGDILSKHGLDETLLHSLKDRAALMSGRGGDGGAGVEALGTFRDGGSGGSAGGVSCVPYGAVIAVTSSSS